MTNKEFANTAFKKNDKIIYKEKIYNIILIDFQNNTFGIRLNPEKNIITYVNCLEVKLIQ